jgi:hypothetical protein
MSLLKHAKRELAAIGMTEDDKDEMNSAMAKHILHMVEEFANEGHSGFSASYAANILNKLFRFEPLCPLTGEDSEWNLAIPHEKDPLWQNNRCLHVFKDSSGAYDSKGIVFYDEIIQEDGLVDRSHFTCRESRVPVTFPYTPKTEYKLREKQE